MILLQAELFILTKIHSIFSKQKAPVKAPAVSIMDYARHFLSDLIPQLRRFLYQIAGAAAHSRRSSNELFVYAMSNYSASAGAPTGQTSAQAPQERHSSALISYLPSPSEMALTGHSLAQAPQEMHSSLILYAICNTSIKCVDSYVKRKSEHKSPLRQIAFAFARPVFVTESCEHIISHLHTNVKHIFRFYLHLAYIT